MADELCSSSALNAKLCYGETDLPLNVSGLMRNDRTSPEGVPYCPFPKTLKLDPAGSVTETRTTVTAPG